MSSLIKSCFFAFEKPWLCQWKDSSNLSDDEQSNIGDEIEDYDKNLK